MMAIKACEILGLNKKNISKCINNLKSVKGRLELVREFSDQTKVFIDFAHTPDAIRAAIISLKRHYEKDITIVFGCGGERDKEKEVRWEKLLIVYAIKYMLLTIIRERKTKKNKKSNIEIY